MLNKGVSIIFSLLPISLGLYLFFNDNFLNTYGPWENKGIAWIDDSIFGITLIILGIFLIIAFTSKNLKLQSIGLVLLGADLFATSAVYFYRWIIGLPNFTWIFSFALFLLIYTSILRVGDREYD